MKTKITLLALTFILLISVSACGSGQNVANAGTSVEAAGTSAGTNGQIKREQPDIMGEVSSISGKEITLKLIEIPVFNGGNRLNQGHGTAQSDQSGSSSAAKSTENSSNSSVTPDNNNTGSRPQGGPSGRRFNSGSKDGTQPNNQAPRMSRKYTGETKTITIPDNVTISSFAGRMDNNQQKNLSVSDIKQGSILQIYYSDKEKQTIFKIYVIGGAPSDSSQGKNQADQTN